MTLSFPSLHGKNGITARFRNSRECREDITCVTEMKANVCVEGTKFADEPLLATRVSQDLPNIMGSMWHAQEWGCSQDLLRGGQSKWIHNLNDLLVWDNVCFTRLYSTVKVVAKKIDWWLCRQNYFAMTKALYVKQRRVLLCVILSEHYICERLGCAVIFLV